jgi:dihydrodipicolinate synthase/N-acetylneuraminate lyase
MSAPANLDGVWPVLVTPMGEDGCFRGEDVDPLLDYAAVPSVAGVVVLGLAGEALQMEVEERKLVAQAFLSAASGRTRVIVGASAATTADACRLAEHAARAGAAALMVAPPSAEGGGRDAMLRHYVAVAKAAGDCALMVQDAPQFVGVEMDAALASELRAACPTMVAIKSEGAPAGLRARRLVEALAGTGVGVFGGVAGLHAPEVYAAGAVGMLPGCEVPNAHGALLAHWNAGRRAEAEALYRRLLPLLAFEMQTLAYVVGCMKAILHRQGVIGGERSRIGPPLDEWSRTTLFGHWDACGGDRP